MEMYLFVDLILWNNELVLLEIWRILYLFRKILVLNKWKWVLIMFYYFVPMGKFMDLEIMIKDSWEKNEKGKRLKGLESLGNFVFEWWKEEWEKVVSNVSK